MPAAAPRRPDPRIRAYLIIIAALGITSIHGSAVLALAYVMNLSGQTITLGT